MGQGRIARGSAFIHHERGSEERRASGMSMLPASSAGPPETMAQ